MKPLILKIGTVAAGAALACCLFGCSETNNAVASQDPVYLPSSMTINKDGTTYVQSYTYDDQGNLISSADSRVKTTGGTFIDASGDASRYEEGASYSSTTAYSLDENGVPVSFDRTVVEGNDQTTTHTDIEIEVNESGLWEEIALLKNGETVLAASIAYEYGLPKAIQRDYGKGPSTVEFDKSGWEADMVNSSDAAYNEQTARLESTNLYGRDFSFEYDENGCLSSIYCDGELETQISYTLIDNPSPAVYSLSHLKLNWIGFGYPYGWYWELGGTFLG